MADHQEPSTPFRQRVVRVFVSSTFRDMHAERGELVKRVFPQLRKMCESRGVTWGEVDLRWGIPDERKAEGKVLPICLEEIRRCRPYFIGILGERYGWVPDAIPQELVDREEWLKEHLDHSVTELEILHGVLRNPEMAEHAFFYLRDPAYVLSLPEEGRSGFLEVPEPEEIERFGPEEANRRAEGRKKKLAVLKGRIRAGGFPTKEYRDPQDFGRQVLQELTGVLDRLYPEDDKIDPLDREAVEHEAFAISRAVVETTPGHYSGVYIGRRGYFDRLDAHAAGAGPPLVVLGESGSGKSALLANWALEYRKTHPGDLVLMHFIGGSPYSTDWAAMVRRIMGEFRRRLGVELEIPDKPDTLRMAFANVLHMAAAEGRVVLVLDALNQLEDRDGAPDLVWLPPEIPANVRLILSTLPGRPLEDLKKRGWPALTVTPLDAPERHDLIERHLAQYAKKLSQPQAERIAAAEQSSNPLYLRALLEELRVFGAHERLDERIAHYLKAGNIPELYERILGRYEVDYERERPGLVRDAMPLIWAARRGLAEAELLDLLGQDGNPLPRAYWSPLYLAAEQSLVNRSGLIGFFHDYLRDAVARRYLPTEEIKKEAHLRLADYFGARDIDARKVDELPWQLRKAESWERLKESVADMELFLEMMRGNQCYDLIDYWQSIGHRFDMELVYCAALEVYGKTTRNEWQLSEAFDAVAVFLYRSGKYDSAERILKKSLDMLERVGPGHPYMADSLDRMANVLRKKGDFDSMFPLVRRALEIREKTLGLAHPKTGVSLDNLAAAFYCKGDLPAAESLMRRALSIFEKTFSAEHPETARSLTSLGVILYAKGDLSAAEQYHRRALSVCEKVFGQDHPETATSCSNLAIALHAKGDIDAAEILHLRALEICVKRLGLEHPKTAASLNNLGAVFFSKGDFSTSEHSHLIALKIRKKALGPTHPDVATSLDNLAAVLSAKGDIATAQRFHQMALSIYMDALGEEHPDTIRCANNKRWKK